MSRTIRLSLSVPFPPLANIMSFFPYPSLRKPLHAFAGAVGSSSNIPSFISSCGLGRCCNFCSRLSARICFCNSLCCPCIEGAALESGRIFPNEHQDISHLMPFTSEISVLNEKPHTYVQSTPPSPAASPILSSNYRSLAGAPVPTARIVSPCFLHSLAPFGVLDVYRSCDRKGALRRGVCVTQDVAVFEILGVGTHLQVLFEGFLTLDGGEGRLVDLGGCVFVGHGFEMCVCVILVSLALSRGEGGMFSKSVGQRSWRLRGTSGGGLP